jgi:hypothetical protein
MTWTVGCSYLSATVRGGMSHHGVTHPRINPGLNCSTLERMPPAMVGLHLRMIDPEGPDPLRQSLRGLHCRPSVFGAPGGLGGSVVKERPGRLALDPILRPGAARGIRTPDPIITKRGAGASRGCTIVRSGIRKCAVVQWQRGALVTSAGVLR